jgi:hypothetical protein
MLKNKPHYDLTGKRFGKLTVISYNGQDKHHNFLWLCNCDCGNTAIVTTSSLTSENKKSCGCLRWQTIDITGQKFGKLTAIKLLERDRIKRRTLWACKCDCGKEVIVRSQSLRDGTIASCGCSRRLKFGEAAFRGVFRRTRTSARIRGYEFQLTETEAKEIMTKPCQYCGVPPSAEAKYERVFGTFIYNGIDRIDNSIGYIKENCVPCCKHCNNGKGTKTVAEFHEWINRVHNHQKKI